jgi:hypothetical protein
MSRYTPRNSNYVGGIFISANGSRRVIPDQWLHEAILEKGSALLRLCYSSCTMEIRGKRLDKIFEDAALSKIGTITVKVPADDAKAINAASSPFVTSIIHVPMSPLAASDLERSDAA